MIRNQAIPLFVLVVLVTAVAVTASDLGRATTTFTDESDFLAANASIAELESFEGLPATNTFTQGSFALRDFVLDTPDTADDSLGVWNTPYVGGFATHGSNWIGFQSDTNERLRWSFDTPINSFGVNITDWGDFGTGALVFSNNAGDSFTVAVTPRPNGDHQFFGVINDSMSFTTVELNQNITGEFYGVDEVLFSSGPCATPANLLVSQGQPVGGSWDYYYGGSLWPELTAAIDAAAASVTVTPNLENLGFMLGFDALWIDQRGDDGDPGSFLNVTEIVNIYAFISTGRRVVMIGENEVWTNWNNQILAILGGSFAGPGMAGTLLQLTTVPLTTGVDAVRMLAAGTANGGTPLFTENVVTSWLPSRNVLTVLDVNMWSEAWGDEDNALFAGNVAKWIGCSAWQAFVFADGFEAGSTITWTASVP